MVSFLKRGNTLDRIVKEFVLTIALAIVASFFVSRLFDSTSHSVTHTILEGINLFVVASTFVIVWLTYDNITPVEKFLGYSFLGSTIFQAFHIYYYLQSNGQVGAILYQSYLAALLTRFVVALAIYVLSRRKKTSMRRSKLAGLVLTLIYAAAILMAIHYFGDDFYNLNEHNILIEGLSIMTLLSLSLLSLRNFSKQQPIAESTSLSQMYIILAIVIAIPADLILFRYEIFQTNFYSLGHLLKVAIHLFLFRGIFVASVVTPYKRLKKSKHNLEANRQYMQDLLNSLPVALWTYNKHHRLTFANKRAEQMLGFKFNDLRGLTNDEISLLFYHRVPEKTMYDRLHHDNEPINNVLIDVETKGGQRLKLKIDMLKLNNGGTMVIFNEAKKDQALDNLQLQTQAILNAVHNMVVIIDSHKKILACNRAFEEITELTSSMVVGQDLDEVVANYLQLPERDRVEISTFARKLYETEITTPSGEEKQLLYHVAPIKNVDEESIGFVIVAADVTLLKSQEKALQHHEKLALLGQMAAGIVHEIRNPLTVIRGYGQLIEMMVDDSRAKEYALQIGDQVEQMNKVVTDFLKFAKPSEPVMVRTSINEVIKSIQLMVESHSFMQRVDIEFKLTDEDRPVCLDPDQVKQVILNMVQNAVEATMDEERGKVEISSRYDKENKNMLLVIGDNGRGISAEELKRVGTPFYTTKDGGTGLGMSICYQIVNEHGGQIRFKSEKGRGTEAIIILPVDAVDKQKVEAKVDEENNFQEKEVI